MVLWIMLEFVVQEVQRKIECVKEFKFGDINRLSFLESKEIY